jgi:hypothetical protein
VKKEVSRHFKEVNQDLEDLIEQAENIDNDRINCYIFDMTDHLNKMRQLYLLISEKVKKTKGERL